MVNVVGDTVRMADAMGPIYINPIIYAEMAPAFSTLAELDVWLAPNIFCRLPLPYAAGWLAAQAFINYRNQVGVKSLCHRLAAIEPIFQM